MSQSVIDLRSDTLTVPCEGMRQAMARAEVGDDVYDEDPTVHRLESRLAEMAGQEAGLFFPSGTQSNLVALLAHCQRGDEYIVGQQAHTYKYEGGGAAVLGGIQPQPIEHAADGTIPLEKIRAAVKENDFHFARTRLLALENTIGGKVVSQDYLDQAAALAAELGLAFHLDGARVFNASVAQGLALADVTSRFDSVSICLSKGIGTPVGSVLVGKRDLLSEAKRWRKVVGGGMRQVGVLAAAGLYALDHNVERLADDHALAAQLAEGLKDAPGIAIRDQSAHTNMVFIDNDIATMTALGDWCEARGVRFGSGAGRLVVHKDINAEQIDRVADVIQGFFADRAA